MLNQLIKYIFLLSFLVFFRSSLTEHSLKKVTKKVSVPTRIVMKNYNQEFRSFDETAWYLVGVKKPNK